MAGRIKHKKPLRTYAEQHGVSLRTIKRRSAAGLPLGDHDIGDAIPPKDQRTPEKQPKLSVEELKRRRAMVAWLREVHEYDVDLNKYVLKDKVREDGIRIGATFAAEFSALLNDMPGILAGLPELKVREKLGARIETLTASIKRQLSDVAR